MRDQHRVRYGRTWFPFIHTKRRFVHRRPWRTHRKCHQPIHRSLTRKSRHDCYRGVRYPMDDLPVRSSRIVRGCPSMARTTPPWSSPVSRRTRPDAGPGRTNGRPTWALPGVQLIDQPQLSVVAFRAEAGDDATRAILDTLLESRQVHVSSTTVDGDMYVRFAFLTNGQQTALSTKPSRLLRRTSIHVGDKCGVIAGRRDHSAISR